MQEGVENEEKTQYNRKTKEPYIQWKSDAFAWANKSTTKIGDMSTGADEHFRYFYEAIDPYNDGRATDYVVIARVSMKNKALLDEWYEEIRNNNEENHASFYENIDEYELARAEYQSNNGTVVAQSTGNGQTSGVHQEKSQSYGDRNSKTSSGNKQNVKFNLKDSLGNELSTEQQEFFKDSKVRDENGNLLVVYHGTDATFNIYKSNNGYEEYFFTDNYSAAVDYGSKVKKQYLNITNPCIVDFNGKYDKEIFDAIDYAKENGFDGVIALNTFDGANTHNQYVAFGKNQIKNTDNKKPTSNPDIRFNLKYTEKEYNDYGWARANDILNVGQNEDYRSKFADLTRGYKTFRKTKNGEYMIPVSDIYDDIFKGINNTIVYAKGTIDKPIITRVLQIDEYDETILSSLRSEIYATERRGIRATTGGIQRLYSPANYGYQYYKQRVSSQETGHNNGLNTNRGASSGEINGVEKQSKVKFNLKSNPQISLSNGEIRKIVANYTRAKVYSRKETEISINNLIEELGELFTTEKISLKGKSKEEAIQMLWQGLNAVQDKDRQAFAEKVAEYIIKNSIVEITYKDADYDYYADVYNLLHSYLHKINLDHIKTETEHKYGKAEAKSIIAKWQSKDGTGMSVDGYADEIN